MRKKIILIIIVIVALVWLNNTSLFMKKNQVDYKILAHRGLAQTFDVSQVEWDTNTASIIYEPEHQYLENTLESMGAAFDYGADIVELDIKRTKDKKLAVFHDYLLEYRTNGVGLVEDYTMTELKKLDIGYGYTADRGATYPFRGKGIGLMPSLDEVLEAFNDKKLLLHVKDDSTETAKLLWNCLKAMPKERQAQISLYGDNAPMEYLRDQSSDLRLMSKSLLKKALVKYELLGWTGYIPKELKNMEIHLPINYAKLLWGWPQKFVERMDSVNTNVIIVNGDGGFSEGFDTVQDLQSVPKGYNGYIWTNRIDKIKK